MGYPHRGGQGFIIHTETMILAGDQYGAISQILHRVIGAMVASQKAGLSFSMLLQVRNKVMSGIDDVMRMSL